MRLTPGAQQDDPRFSRQRGAAKAAVGGPQGQGGHWPAATKAPLRHAPSLA